MTYARQLTLKRDILVDALRRIGRLELSEPPEIVGSPDDGYRMRARLHVRGGRIGFFREGTHDLCDARPTRQLLPATCDVLDRLAAGLASLGVRDVSDVELSENREATGRAIHLNTGDPIRRASLAGLRGMDGLTGLTTSGPRGEAVLIAGEPFVTDLMTVGETTYTLRRHVQAFFQGNRHLVGTLVSHVFDRVPASQHVVDLYAGVGLFAVGLAARGSRVTAVEGDPIAARDLAGNGKAAGNRFESQHKPVEAFLHQLPERPDTLLVDPPRTGMSREAVSGAVGLRAPRVVYVSCDVATLARDARSLVDAGYGLDEVRGFDMFPNTPHVEAVVVFTKP